MDNTKIIIKKQNILLCVQIDHQLYEAIFIHLTKKDIVICVWGAYVLYQYLQPFITVWILCLMCLFVENGQLYCFLLYVRILIHCSWKDWRHENTTVHQPGQFPYWSVNRQDFLPHQDSYTCESLFLRLSLQVYEKPTSFHPPYIYSNITFSHWGFL